MSNLSDLIQAEKASRTKSGGLPAAIRAEKERRASTPKPQTMADGFGNVAASMMGEVSAGLQGTSPVTRDISGESTRPIVGEYAPGDGLGYIRTQDGGLVDFSPSKHTALRDDASGKVMVYERTPDTDESRLTSLGRVMSLGALSPVTKAATTVARGAPSVAARNMADFDAAGVRPPSLGTITEGRGTRIIEEAGRNNPVTGGQFSRADTRAVDDLAASVERTAGKFGDAQSPYDVGGVVRSGIDQYSARLDALGEKLFDPVHRAIGDATEVDLSATRSFLESEADRFANYPGLEQFLTSPQMKTVKSALDSAEALPYSLLKELRTKVGTRLKSGKVRDDTDEALLKGLYGSLSDDMKSAAQQAGVLDKFTRANAIWSKEMDRTKDLNRLYSKANERIASDVEAMARGGTSRTSFDAIKNLFGALKGDQRKEVASGLIRSMGLQKAGEADSFSATRFLTAFEKMDPKSRDLLFGTADNALRKELNALIRVASTLRKADEVKQRPNTAVPIMGAGTLGALAGGMYLSPELTVLATMTGATASALLTSPKFIRLVRQFAESGRRVPANRLALIARDGPQQAAAIREFQAAVAEQEQSGPAR